MQLKDLKVKDVLHSTLYEEQLRRQLIIEEETQTRIVVGGRTNRTTLDRLRERGVWNVKALPVLWVQILGKSLQGYSATERVAISRVCLRAYRNTMKKVMKVEEAEK